MANNDGKDYAVEKLKALLVVALEKFLRVKVLRNETWNFLLRFEPANLKILRWSRLPEGDFFGLRAFILEHVRESPSQLQQDLVAQFIVSKSRRVFDSKKLPFYVEIGANDGVYLSNTLILQESFGWRGILSEANDLLREELAANRKGALIDSRAVTKKTGEKVVFHMSENSEFSSIDGSSIQKNQFINSRKTVKDTICLTDLLKHFDAPSVIDFLSVDTEGSEFEILCGLDFSLYRFNFIAVEVSRNSNEIAELLTLHAYKQILQEVSRWDQWWVDASLFEELEKTELSLLP